MNSQHRVCIRPECMKMAEEFQLLCAHHRAAWMGESRAIQSAIWAAVSADGREHLEDLQRDQQGRWRIKQPDASKGWGIRPGDVLRKRAAATRATADRLEKDAAAVDQVLAAAAPPQEWAVVVGPTTTDPDEAHRWVAEQMAAQAGGKPSAAPPLSWPDRVAQVRAQVQQLHDESNSAESRGVLADVLESLAFAETNGRAEAAHYEREAAKPAAPAETNGVTEEDVAAAVEFFGCDGAGCLRIGRFEEGSEGPGVYVWCGEYPEDGGAFLGDGSHPAVAKLLELHGGRDAEPSEATTGGAA